MRKIFRFCMFLALVSITAIPCFSDCAAQLVINEFLADPARDWDGDGALSSRDDEWVEIANLGSAAVDLAGYRLADGEGRPVWRYGFSGTLAAGAVRIVYGSDARAWEEASGFPVYGLSLNNAGDRIALYRISGADTAVVDSYHLCRGGDPRRPRDREAERHRPRCGSYSTPTIHAPLPAFPPDRDAIRLPVR